VLQGQGAKADNENHQDDADSGKPHLPIQLGQHQRDLVDDGLALIAQGRRLAVFLGPPQFVIQSGKQGRAVQLEQSSVVFHRPANIDRRGENIKVSIFQRSQMIGANLGGISHLFDRQAAGLTGGAELFSNRRHLFMCSRFHASLAIL
jgi:hypothetical protein